MTFNTYTIDELDQTLLLKLRQVFNLSAFSNIYQNPDYQIYIAHYFRINTFLLIAEDDSGILGYWFVFSVKKGKLNTYLTPYQKSLCPYGGPLLLNDDVKILNGFLFKLKKLCKIWSVYLKSAPFTDIEPYKNQNFKITAIPTLIIDLSAGENKVWNDVQNRIRRNINNALKNVVKISYDSGERIIELSKIYHELCERKGLLYHEPEFYKKSFSILNNNGKSKIFYATIEDKIVSAMSVLVHAKSINPWFGGTLFEYVDSGAGSLLYWEIMKYGINIGCERFDFLGLDVASIAFYKKGFGGNEVPVYHITKKNLPFKYLNFFMKYF